MRGPGNADTYPVKRFLCIAALFLAGTVARAGVYTYRDENGTLHAVSSPTDIPEQYRGKEKVLAGSETGSGEVNLKLEREGNSLLIPVSFGGGKEVLMVLDTGASVSMISREVADRIRPQQLGLAQISTASGVIRVPVVDVPEISVKQFAVHDMHITVNDLPGKGRAAGLLGVDFLNHFRMQLDTESGQLHLERK